ncbi:MAG: ABC transporter ATP-binding protein [Rhodovibrionaceae bacterium]
MNAEAVIQVAGVTYDYPGLRALSDVGFAVEAGSIVAMVGANGAGKSTLLRCMAALDRPLAGEIRIAGQDVFEDSRAAHRRLGYLPDFFGLYDELTVRQCLAFRAAALGVEGEAQAGAVETAARRLRIDDRMGARAGTLSRGLRQRLAIAQAIIHEPEVLLLDEPASGLDPEARIGLAAVLRALRDSGMTLVVSSHILAELEDYSSHLLILEAGRLVEYRALDGAAAPRASGRTTLRLVMAEPVEDLAGRLAAVAGLSRIEGEGRIAQAEVPADPAAQHGILKAILAAGLPLAEFAPLRGSLQDAYIARLQTERRAMQGDSS